MKLIMLSFSKKETYDDTCVVEYAGKGCPMIIASEIECKPRYLAKYKEYEADVKFSSFCWASQREMKPFSCHVTDFCQPFTFIASRIEEIIDMDLVGKEPYVKYRTTLYGKPFEMTLTYPTRKKEEGPIKDVFKVGDWIYGLFKAKVTIKESLKGMDKNELNPSSKKHKQKKGVNLFELIND